jgi:hypothetical protein
MSKKNMKRAMNMKLKMLERKRRFMARRACKQKW